MGTINVTLGDATELNLLLGQQLENEVNEVVFDFSAWKTTYGSGDIELSVQRHGDAMPYPVTLTVSGTDATWTITDTDTACKGIGEAQVTYTVSDVKKKSCVYKFTVYRSLGEDGEYPAPGSTWCDQVEQDIADIKADLGDLTDLETTVKTDLVSAINEIASGGSGSGLTDDIKQALLDCFENVYWNNDDGHQCYDALEAALYPPAELTSISAVYTQSGTVYDTDTLDDLKTDLVVTAHYSDTTTAPITAYALSGSLTVGTSTITVSYGGKTTTFTVTVTAAPDIPVEYQEVEWIEFDGDSRIVTTASGDIKHSYDVKAFVDDNTEQFIAGLCSSNAAEVEIGKAANENRLFLYASSSLSISNITDLTSYPAVITAHFEKSVSRDITAVVNGNEYTNTASNPTKNVTSSHKFVLGSAGTGSQRYGYTGKIYYAKYYANDVLACDLVPCYRIADTVIGFYDKVSETFYTNSGTGTLVKGSDVS